MDPKKRKDEDEIAAKKVRYGKGRISLCSSPIIVRMKHGV
jgi:hypothetical protein